LWYVVIMDEESRKLLMEGARGFGHPLSEEAVEAFAVYLRELLKWNEKMNLTAIRTEREIVLKHFVDSLSLLPHLSEAETLLDMGSGAGFPGIPLKIVKPRLRIVLLDSVRKKVDFQRHILRTLSLSDIEAVHGRAQEQSIIEGLGKRFDVVVSRAFADLQVFLKLSLPFLRPCGKAIAMKGKVTDEVIQGFREDIKAPYVLEGIFRFVLPRTTLQRTLLVFRR